VHRHLQTKSPAKAQAAAAAAAPCAKLPKSPKPPTRKAMPKASLEASLSPAARDSIAAAAAAAAKLPTTQELLDSGKVTKIPDGGGGWGHGGGADTTPESHGKKDYPSGHPDCLTKYTFVLSGVLDSMFRQEAVDYIQRHGGRVTSGVTGRTTFLLCGMKTFCVLQSCTFWGATRCSLAFISNKRPRKPSDASKPANRCKPPRQLCHRYAGKDTGNSKFSSAKAKGTQLIDEDGLLSLVKASVPFVEEETDPARVAASCLVRTAVSGAAMYGASGATACIAGTSSSKAVNSAARPKAVVDPGALCGP
jgi:replication factor C subunit 1